ncbi:CLUMA_CG015690, isoform A [Clunio marinus]|uniref:CLUMA_CG015690, isoform A n=1 Tax=Clunio marinus TaxID=568069 RepID=A0A1J1IQH6_9DIPT|nr:CLUMA_CG015690, isoform A [Clunio marinus]
MTTLTVLSEINDEGRTYVTRIKPPSARWESKVVIQLAYHTIRSKLSRHFLSKLNSTRTEIYANINL